MPLQRPTTDSCWKHAIAAGRTMFFLGKWWDSAPIYGEMGIKDWIWGLQNSISYNNWGKNMYLNQAQWGYDMIWWGVVWIWFLTNHLWSVSSNRETNKTPTSFCSRENPWYWGSPSLESSQIGKKMTDWEDWAEKMTSSSGKFPKTVTIS